MSGKRIYVSGIISLGGRLAPHAVQKNIDRMRDVEKLLQGMGYEVVSPLDVSTSAATWEEHMRLDIAALVTCDGICLTDGWERSRGARLEQIIAHELGMYTLHEEEMIIR